MKLAKLLFLYFESILTIFPTRITLKFIRFLLFILFFAFKFDPTFMSINWRELQIAIEWDINYTNKSQLRSEMFQKWARYHKNFVTKVSPSNSTAFSPISFVCQSHIFSSILYPSADATRRDTVSLVFGCPWDTGDKNFKIEFKRSNLLNLIKID